MHSKSSKLRAGDWVEVRSKEEILATLDGEGRLDGMPFMPEMFAFCGKTFPVYKRAHKTCDTVFPVRGRRVASAVHLETRCDGSAHGGCQASCLLFWKDAWLKPILRGSNRAESQRMADDDGAVSALARLLCEESRVWDGTQKGDPTDGSTMYVCQATQLPYATTDLDWWDIRQYAEDYLSGNVGLWRIFCGAVYALSYALSWAGIGLGRPIRWFYDTFHALWRGTPFPRRNGTIPEGQPTPAEILNLQPGELVRVKSHKEILKTLNTKNRNRGLYWDAEEVPFCGRTYRVLKRVTKIINERTGKMRETKSPCILLDSAMCQARYSECRYFCPRSIYSFFHEIWLERIEPKPLTARTERDSRGAA